MFTLLKGLRVSNLKEEDTSTLELHHERIDNNVIDRRSGMFLKPSDWSSFIEKFGNMILRIPCWEQ